METFESDRLNIQCMQRHDTKFCYTLYHFPGKVSWDQAYDHCLSRDEHLAVIPDKNVQDTLRRLSLEGAEATSHAWVAGRRSQSTEWRLSNNTRYHDIIPVVEGDCGWLHEDDGGEHSIQTKICVTNTIDGYRGICQYPLIPSGTCPGYHEGAHCVVLTTRTHTSWFDAHMACLRMNPNAKLLYSYINDRDLYIFLGTLAREDFWIGLSRKPWQWVSGEWHQQMHQDMEYYSWQHGSGSTKGIREPACTYLDLKEGSDWGDAPCYSTKSYAVCETRTRLPNPGPTSTETTRLMTSGGSVYTSNDMTAPNCTARDCLPQTKAPAIHSSTSLQHQDINILIGCLVGGIAILVLVILVLVIMLRKKSKTKSLSKARDCPLCEGSVSMSPLGAGMDRPPSVISDGQSWVWDVFDGGGGGLPRGVSSEYAEPWDLKNVLFNVKLEPDAVSELSLRGVSSLALNQAGTSQTTSGAETNKNETETSVTGGTEEVNNHMNIRTGTNSAEIHLRDANTHIYNFHVPAHGESIG